VHRALLQSLRSGARMPGGSTGLRRGVNAQGRPAMGQPAGRAMRRPWSGGRRGRGGYGYGRPYGVVYGATDGAPVGSAYAGDDNGDGYDDAASAAGGGPAAVSPNGIGSGPSTMASATPGRSLTGRWFRRGNKIILVGV
jgi:hypothetical protein